ncbi:MAG: DUF4474 domain-containing protein [Oscillospiraceae bacterium]|jgi:hypothetical protein|nr:DUF4474 domain-containing protein [Oscillospiraceae bacterium]
MKTELYDAIPEIESPDTPSPDIDIIPEPVPDAPTTDGNLSAEHEALNEVLKTAGFAYNAEGDYFYSLKDCWQRECGYCRLYDDACKNFNMVTDAEPFEFEFGGKRWLIELWKGQYGITTGCEIGIYNTDRPNLITEAFTGPFYDCVTDAEMMPMSFTLYKKGKVLLERSGTAWWLTAFRLGEFSHRRSLVMDASITLPSVEMAEALAAAVAGGGYTEDEYSRDGSTVNIHFTKPHGDRNILERAHEFAIQKLNEVNTSLYRTATSGFPSTLAALSFVQSTAPTLFAFMVNSLYAHAVFDAFSWLKAAAFPSAVAGVVAAPPIIAPPTPIRYFDAKPEPPRYFDARPDSTRYFDAKPEPQRRRVLYANWNPAPAPVREPKPLPFLTEFIANPADAPRVARSLPTRVARSLPTRVAAPATSRFAELSAILDNYLALRCPGSYL